MAPVLAGAILGWWLLGWRGTLLFPGQAVAAIRLDRLIARRRPGFAVALALLAAALTSARA